MIKIYEYYSEGFGCNMQLSYQDGILIKVEAENPNIEVRPAAGNTTTPKCYFFIYEVGFLEVIARTKQKVTEINRIVTFDMFWDKYKYKTSGKPEAERAWNKLNAKDKLEAYDYIDRYESILKLNPVAKLYGSSYLNAKRWIK